MKIFNHPHRHRLFRTNGVTNRTTHWVPNGKRGSILIWTTMLGLLLTSVFFMFSMRQRLMLSAQRDTVAIQNTKMFLESYADYLEKNPKEIWIDRIENGHTIFYPKSTVDGIATRLTQNVDSIEDMVDAGEEKSYAFDGAIFVEWNKCDATQGQKGNLLVNDVIYPHAGSNCTGFYDMIGPISVSTGFKIRTLNEPFDFKIRGAEGTQALDNLWHLELSKDLGYGKKITINKTF